MEPLSPQAHPHRRTYAEHVPRLLVSNADNEFVGKLIESLSTKHDIPINALGAEELDVEGVELVTEPGNETHVLLTMPNNDEAAPAAIELIDALPGDEHLLFIANNLDPSHAGVIEHIQATGKHWTIIHPIAMMDFAFAALPPQISMAGVVFGISGRSQVGFVAASDIMRVLATVITQPGHEHKEYVCTGPEALDMPTVVAQLSEVLGRELDYIDLDENELKTLMVQYGRQDADMVERLIFSQLRAWRDGHADVVTDSVEHITGQAPMSVREWFEAHRDDYGKGAGLAQKAAAKLVKARYRGKVMRAD
jgi:uncharacterized protein YbjT (DUF2867 family)